VLTTATLWLEMSCGLNQCYKYAISHITCSLLLGILTPHEPHPQLSQEPEQPHELQVQGGPMFDMEKDWWTCDLKRVINDSDRDVVALV